MAAAYLVCQTLSTKVEGHVAGAGDQGAAPATLGNSLFNPARKPPPDQGVPPLLGLAVEAGTLERRSGWRMERTPPARLASGGLVASPLRGASQPR